MSSESQYSPNSSGLAQSTISFQYSMEKTFVWEFFLLLLYVLARVISVQIYGGKVLPCPYKHWDVFLMYHILEAESRFVEFLYI